MGNKKMKRLLETLLLLCSILLIAANSFALPVVGDSITITTGDNRPFGFAGGEFKLSNSTSGYEYISFCVEWYEHITIPGSYTVDTVADYAKAGGGGAILENGELRDYLSDQTKWLMNEYINGGLKTKYSGQNAQDLNIAVQVAIWTLENEYYTASYNSDLASDLITLTDGLGSDYKYLAANVKVVNLIKDGELAQSQIVAAHTPEPTTMLLLGTGLIGLAGVSRKKSKK